jgi:hypothetical protein
MIDTRHKRRGGRLGGRVMGVNYTARPRLSSDVLAFFALAVAIATSLTESTEHSGGEKVGHG